MTDLNKNEFPDSESHLKRGSGVAVWRQIAERLGAEIRAGHRRQGEKIANEIDLARTFGVNRHTVRRAIAALVQDGLLEARRGKGTFVADSPIDYPIGARTRFSEIVSAQSRVPGGKLLRSCTEPADSLTSEKLRVPETTNLIRLETLAKVDGVPLSTSTAWFVANMVPDLVAIYRRTSSVTEVFKTYGLGDYQRAETRMTAQLAGPEDALLLEIDTSAPVMVTENLNVDADGRPIQFARTRFAAERVQLVVKS